MNEITPRNVALRAALSITLVFLLLLSVIHVIFASIGWLIVAGATVLVSVISYLVIYHYIERFINRRIKVIYKTIHTLKSTRNPAEAEIDMSKDFLDDINQEVKSWADEKAAEIRDLRRRDDYRKEFIGNLAHELRTPIFNIQGYILTLIEGALDDPEINQKFLMRASNSVDRMIIITNDLDTISQFESGSMDLKQEKFNVVNLAKEVIDGLEFSAKKHNIKVCVSKKNDSVVMVVADRFRISQVFMNLISNAINYGRENGKCVISFDDLDEYVLVEVTDDGPGIAAKHLPRLFERFYRVDKSRSKNRGGTGLGLAIVKHIVEAHGQSINVRSEEGKGTTVSFTLKKA